jgi:hypothetical protein
MKGGIMHTKGKDRRFTVAGNSVFLDNEFYAEFASDEEALKAGKTFNAADGMTTEEAVRHLEHGREMELFIRDSFGSFDSTVRVHAEILLAKLEGK